LFMVDRFDFEDLFVLDLANNHQGQLEHGRSIVRQAGEVVRKNNIRAGLKFQFRQLDTFIHPAHQRGSVAKQIDRFLSTQLTRDEFQKLFEEVNKQGMQTICTPFDEGSVDVIDDMGFDIIKVASCSARDWPLLEKISSVHLPVIFSTGGLSLVDIDNLVSFFEHRGNDFAIMHCVSIYPIPDENFQLNQIGKLIERNPNRVIGWSTHEDPDATVPVCMAVAKGARMFERHIGVETQDIKLNAYSSTPHQLDLWLKSWRHARTLCGAEERPPATDVEKKSLDSLRRGVYARKRIRAGQKLASDLVYFAMPYVDGQLESGRWNGNLCAEDTVDADEPVLASDSLGAAVLEIAIIKQAVHEVRGMLNEARVHLNSNFAVEYSHHYGISRFRDVGAIIVECFNREYCKKIIIQLPGQIHPSHFHTKKEETFQVLHGILKTEVDGHEYLLNPGETILIQRGVWHSFWTETGVIFEEISTSDHSGDSTYRDKAINALQRSERKTVVDHWGRFQI